MKVQAINNTAFQGKFTNKTSENGGNWRMEYSPYSWEVNNEGEFKMAPQTDLDLFANRLPDNDKIYTSIEREVKYGSPVQEREFCKDILGTKFYFSDFVRKNVRKTITEMPAMNREESLRVYDKKLDKFIKLKENLKNKTARNFDEIRIDLIEADNNYKSNSAVAKTGWRERAYNKEHYRSLCDTHHNMMADKALELHSEAKKYAALVDSISSVKELKKAVLAEIELLEYAKAKGLLIDISRRDIYDPNKALWEALQDMKCAIGKFVVLPHKTISVKNILDKIGINANSKDVSGKAIKFVDDTIRKALLKKRI